MITFNPGFKRSVFCLCILQVGTLMRNNMRSESFPCIYRAFALSLPLTDHDFVHGSEQLPLNDKTEAQRATGKDRHKSNIHIDSRFQRTEGLSYSLQVLVYMLTTGTVSYHFHLSAGRSFWSSSCNHRW